MSETLNIQVCEALAREVNAAVDAAKYPDVHVSVFPCRCHQRGTEAPSPVAADSGNHRALGPENTTSDLDSYVLAGQCLSEPAGHTGSVGMLCFELLVNRAVVDSYVETGAYLISPGWLADWRERIADWGFDKEGAVAFFGESADRLVLLDAGGYPDSAQDLEEFADYVQRPWQRVPIGLDHLRLKLNTIVYEWRLQKLQLRADIAAAKARREVADRAMMLDLLGSLGATVAEASVVKRVLDLIVTLFAPRQAIYLPFENRQAQAKNMQFAGAHPTSGQLDTLGLLPDGGDSAFPLQTEDGFAVCVGSPEIVLGVLSVEGIAFPEHIDHYLNLLMEISPVLALAVQNSRRLAQLRQLQRAEAINTLAHGMGHEINNPLTGIMNYAQLIKDGTKEASDIGEFATEIIVESERIARLLEHLQSLTDSMQQTPGKSGGALDAVHMAVTATRGELENDGIRVVYELPPDVPAVPCDAHAFGKLLVHLMNNARDSLNARYPDMESEKCITIRMAIRNDAGGRLLRTTVEDAGAGIADAHKHQIWDPFFTTRSRVEHAGLGLSLSQRIVHDAKGRLWYENLPQGGARFYVDLPLDAEMPSDEAIA